MFLQNTYTEIQIATLFLSWTELSLTLADAYIFHLSISLLYCVFFTCDLQILYMLLKNDLEGLIST